MRYDMYMSPTTVQWIEFVSLFTTIIGFVIGLGAVNVIDFHAFMGRHSKYWTEASVRTHKITKPLIWVGILLGTVGSIFYYQGDEITPIISFQIVVGILIILNGLFLTFWASPLLIKNEREGHPGRILPPHVQRIMAGCFTFSFIGWWTLLTLLIWHITMVH